MANRTYLYSTDLIPSHDNAGQQRSIVGLSESNYSVPLIYRALIAGSPRLCLSNIWSFRSVAGGLSEPLAIVAPYPEGLENLVFFQQSVIHPDARPLLDEAVAFLSQPANQRPYLLLELAEYISMMDDDEEPKGKLPVKIAAFCADHQGDPRESLSSIAAKLNALPREPSATSDARQIVGSCVWSNILYHEPDVNGA